jgi:hypothetical protein
MEPTSITERAALLGWLFAQGARLTVHDVARRCNLSLNGAYKMLDRASLVLPIALIDGYWQVIIDGKPSHLTR